MCIYTNHNNNTIDEVSLQPRRFLIQVEPTLKELLSREDTDQNMQITIEDQGPKVHSNILLGQMLG